MRRALRQFGWDVNLDLQTEESAHPHQRRNQLSIQNLPGLAACEYSDVPLPLAFAEKMRRQAHAGNDRQNLLRIAGKGL